MWGGDELVRLGISGDYRQSNNLKQIVVESVRTH